MTKGERKLLEAKSGIGKQVWLKFKGKPGLKLWGTIEDEVSIIVNDYKHLIQKIALEPGFKNSDSSDHKFAYRTAYYTLAAKSRKPVFGQYATVLFESDYRRLARIAHEKGWLGLPVA
jgi:hypothetical protein